ncbi:MAG TPA: polysaccharide deacetylase family protein [Longimicrobium sp.]|jgi:peptidoglycan/xylan/chitin deacetylase (PgdA/CDA1 family)
MRGFAVGCVALVLAGCAAEGAPGAKALVPARAAGEARRVAVTFDDLPWGRMRAYSDAQVAELTGQLVGQITSAGMPALGFVNEEKLEGGTGREALLRRWVDAGLELGNHTYSHPSFWTTPRERYQAEVLDGERVTRRLMATRGTRPRFFRHPYLNTGPDLATKEAFERFLASHGYQVAPVTVDNHDYLYAFAYDRALARRDSAAMRRLGADYVRYMDTTFAFYEALSRRLLGREPAQVLLLHANALNAEYLDELAAVMRRRGYTFAPLDRVMTDPAYRQPDRYTGRAGISWLQRWAITRGVDPGEPPPVTPWVAEAAAPDR